MQIFFSIFVIFLLKRKQPHVALGRFRLAIKESFFTRRVDKYWNRLPREVMESSLQGFRRHVDVALRDVGLAVLG